MSWRGGIVRQCRVVAMCRPTTRVSGASHDVVTANDGRHRRVGVVGDRKRRSPVDRLDGEYVAGSRVEDRRGLFIAGVPWPSIQHVLEHVDGAAIEQRRDCHWLPTQRLHQAQGGHEYAGRHQPRMSGGQTHGDQGDAAATANDRHVHSGVSRLWPTARAVPLEAP